MSSAAVFITSEEAKIFYFKPEGLDVQTLRYEGPQHASESLGRNHAKKESDSAHFLKDVAEQLVKSGSTQWLFLGPGLAKSHLQHLIEAKYPRDASKIVGVAGMNKSTDGQITDFAHSFFKRRNLYVG